MIRADFTVPSNYYTRSRDFQLIGRILDCVFNSSKSYSDMVQYDAICKNTDRRLLDLITKTVGFDPKRKYDETDLFILCNTFKYVIRRKGTISAVEDCVRLLLRAQNISKPFYVYDLDNGNPDDNMKLYQLEILIPEELTDIALLEDLLDYILPTGYVYSIISSSQLAGDISEKVATYTDRVSSAEFQNSELGHVYKGTTTETSECTELSVVYRPDDVESE